MARTGTTAHAVLGLLALRPHWTTWQLATELKRNLRFFWPRAESRILAELKALHMRGLVEAQREYVGRRARTVYSITTAGRRELAAWLETPPGKSTLASEPLLRLMLSDFGSPATMSAALDRIERDAQDILDVGRVLGPLYAAGEAPFQDQVHVRAFVYDYLSAYAMMLLGWVERTRAALQDWPRLSPEERATRAAGRIRQRSAELPAPLDTPTPGR